MYEQNSRNKIKTEQVNVIINGNINSHFLQECWPSSSQDISDKKNTTMHRSKKQVHHLQSGSHFPSRSLAGLHSNHHIFFDAIDESQEYH